MRRFVNADIIAGSISNAVTLNRFAYANGNPVSFVDPFGLSAERGRGGCSVSFSVDWSQFADEYYVGKTTFEAIVNNDILEAGHQYMRQGVLNASRPNNIGKGIWKKRVDADLKWLDDVLGINSNLSKTVDAFGYVGALVDVGVGVRENIQNGTDAQRIVTDAIVDAGVSIGGGFLATIASTAAVGAVSGSVAPGVGNLIGAGVGLVVGVGVYFFTEVLEINDKSAVDWLKESADWIADSIVDWFN